MDIQDETGQLDFLVDGLGIYSRKHLPRRRYRLAGHRARLAEANHISLERSQVTALSVDIWVPIKELGDSHALGLGQGVTGIGRGKGVRVAALRYAQLRARPRKVGAECGQLV